MGNTTKPRRKYRPRLTTLDPVRLAMRRAAKIPAAEVAAVMEPVKQAFRAMREGVASERDWIILAGTVELALAVEREGVVRGILGHLTAAEDALRAIKHRAMDRGAWRPTAMYWQEIEALDTFVLLHNTQLTNLSEGEFRRAHARAEATVLSAGGVAFDIRELDTNQGAQLQLLDRA
jgi:hypothetical protein